MTFRNKAQAVIGIDIGTSASGYAFAFIDAPNSITDGNLPNNPRYHKVRFSSLTSCARLIIELKLFYLKAPTVLLIDEDGEFKAFGLDALAEYAQEENVGHLFSKFKLALVGAQSDPQVSPSASKSSSFQFNSCFIGCRFCLIMEWNIHYKRS